MWDSYARQHARQVQLQAQFFLYSCQWPMAIVILCDWSSVVTDIG